ncbi:MAG: serine/threonine protein kinase [Deltaproteobacteria bacterium]|nr:serine/threonine protein kinase [Deltaproteobacteria bacterium]
MPEIPSTASDGGATVQSPPQPAAQAVPASVEPSFRIGRYEILPPELGKGGMGVVYRARDPHIGRHIAIKTIPTTVTPDHEHFEEFRRRLFREAQAAGKLNHANIVTVYDVGEADGQLYVVMELIDGRSLDKVIRAGEAPPADEVFHFIGQAGAALDYAHAQGIIHRDIKPANLLVSADRQLKVADFGIAKLSTSTITQEGGRLGSPSYMSPEQVDGRVIDGRSDLWSLGVVLYQLLTGEKPFKGSTVAAITHQIVNGTFVPPSELNPRLPRRIDRIVEKALQKEPERRFQSGGQLASELRKIDLDELRGLKLSYAKKGREGSEPRRSRDSTPVPLAPSQIESVFQNLTYSARTVGMVRTRQDWWPWAALAAGTAILLAGIWLMR